MSGMPERCIGTCPLTELDTPCVFTRNCRGPEVITEETQTRVRYDVSVSEGDVHKIAQLGVAKVGEVVCTNAGVAHYLEENVQI